LKTPKLRYKHQHECSTTARDLSRIFGRMEEEDLGSRLLVILGGANCLKKSDNLRTFEGFKEVV